MVKTIRQKPTFLAGVDIPSGTVLLGPTQPAALRGAAMMKIVPPDVAGTTDEVSGIIMERPSSAWGSTATGGNPDYSEGQFLAFFQEAVGGDDNNEDAILFRVDKYGALGLIGGIHVAANKHSEIPGMTQAVWIQPTTDMVGVALNSAPGTPVQPFIYAANAAGTELAKLTADGFWSVPLGTEALPAYTFKNDPNTGLWSPAADQVALSVGGNMSMLWNAEGTKIDGDGGWFVVQGSAYGITFFANPVLTTSKAIVARGAAGHTGSLFEAQNNAGTALTTIDANGDLSVPDLAYSATTWDGSLKVPTRNAIRDKIESMAKTGTNAQRLALSGGALVAGLTFFETDTNQMYIYDGTAWRLEFTIGIWTAYTPTDTGVTVGNGTRVAAYRMIDPKTCQFRWSFQLGSTSAIGVNCAAGLPFASRLFQSGHFQVVPAYYLDTGTRNHIGVARIQANLQKAEFMHAETGGSGSVDATSPFTWTNTDQIQCSGIYEIA